VLERRRLPACAGDRHADRGYHGAAHIADGECRAADARRRLLALHGDSALAHEPQVALESGQGHDGVGCHPRQRVRIRPERGERGGREVGEHRLAEGRGVGREALPDARGQAQGLAALDLREVEDIGALEQGDAHGLIGLGRQRAGRLVRGTEHVESRRVRVAQLQDPLAESVFARVALALKVAARDERRQQFVCRGARHAGQPHDVGGGERPRRIQEQLEDVERPHDGGRQSGHGPMIHARGRPAQMTPVDIAAPALFDI
jgi:hypothetical protein